MESITNLKFSDVVEILVVDASDVPSDYSWVDSSKVAGFRIIPATPGLPSQRNVGLELTFNPIIVFLDDDVTLPENFICETISEFEVDHQLAGLGYLLSGVKYESKSRIFPISKGVKTSDFGQVSKSGNNFWYPASTFQEEKSPMWIPGCAMAFRRSLVQNLVFNPVLEKGILGGYALGEDVDFTLRLHERGGKLKLCTALTVNHYEAQSERADSLNLAKARGAWLRYLSKSHPLISPPPYVFMRLIIKFLFQLVAGSLRITTMKSPRFALLEILSFLGPTPYRN